MGGKTSLGERAQHCKTLHSSMGHSFVQPVGEGCPLVPRLEEGKGHFSYQLEKENTYVLATAIKAPSLNTSIAKAKPNCWLRGVKNLPSRNKKGCEKREDVPICLVRSLIRQKQSINVIADVSKSNA